MRRWLLVNAVLVAILASEGCGDNGPKKVSLSGTVTLDGQPLSTGTIAFYSAEGRPPESTPITAGAFTLDVTFGEKRVEIRSYRARLNPIATVPGRPEDPMENFLPARYNNASELKATVPTADNKLTFALTSTLQ